MRLPKSRPARVWTRARRRRSWRAGARARISRPRTSGRASSASKACRSSSSTNGSPSRARRSPKRCSTPCSKRRKSPRLPRRNEAAIPMDRPPAKAFPVSFHPRAGDAALARRLSREIEGEVLFDPASRGRYSTDASIYQIDPVGVVVPKTEQDAKIALQIAVEEGVPVLPRGAGSSQCGQTVGAALVIDHSKFLDRIVSFDKEAATAVVQPGVVLDRLNAHLRRDGLWFAVDPLRQHGAQRARHRCAARRRQRALLRPGAGRYFAALRRGAVRGAREEGARYRRARGGRNRNALAEGAAPRPGIQRG